MGNINRRHFLKTMGSLMAVPSIPSLAPSLSKFTSGEQGDRPNIVFLFSDDQSVPDLGAYGNQVIHTPNLDRLATQGMRFNRAYVSSPQCSPSRASILTGRIPHDVHASRLHSDVPEYVPNMVQMLNKAGYFTGAFRKVHQPTIRDDFQFYGNDQASFESFFEKRPDDQPFFLHFGSHDPHRGYQKGAFNPPTNPDKIPVPEYLPDTPVVRQDLANYYDELARFDKDCGELLALLEQHGLVENTMVVMSGDNGLPFPRAKGTLYEPGINVPLLIKWPGHIREGHVSNELVSLMDLTATWLEMAGVSVPDIMQSKSMLPLFGDENASIRDYIFAERNWHDNWDPMRCIVSKSHKLIQNYRPEKPYIPSLDLQNSPSYKEIQRLISEQKLPDRLSWYKQESRPQVEFYDLDDDPHEWNNLAGQSQYADLVKQYQLDLGKWMNDTHDFLPPPRNAFPGPPDSGLNKRINPLNAQPYENN